MKERSFWKVSLPAVMALCLTGCGGRSSHPHQAPLDRKDQERRNFGSLIGEGGFDLFGKGKKGSSTDGPTANPYLWRAGLESLRFLPLASADVRGGVVVSDWYTFPERPGERFKVSLFVKSAELKAEALEVMVHRQKGAQGSILRDDAKAKEIEDLIVKRARSLYIESKGSKP